MAFVPYFHCSMYCTDISRIIVNEINFIVFVRLCLIVLLVFIWNFVIQVFYECMSTWIAEYRKTINFHYKKKTLKSASIFFLFTKQPFLCFVISAWNFCSRPCTLFVCACVIMILNKKPYLPIAISPVSSG